MTTSQRELLGDALFLSVSGEGRRVRTSAGASLGEVAGAIGMDLLSLIRWELGQLEPAGPEGADWARVILLLRHRAEQLAV